jgi:hypothetical protein
LAKLGLLSSIFYTLAPTRDIPQTNDKFVLESPPVDHIEFKCR